MPLVVRGQRRGRSIIIVCLGVCVCVCVALDTYDHEQLNQAASNEQKSAIECV